MVSVIFKSIIYYKCVNIFLFNSQFFVHSSRSSRFFFKTPNSSETIRFCNCDHPSPGYFLMRLGRHFRGETVQEFDYTSSWYSVVVNTPNSSNTIVRFIISWQRWPPSNQPHRAMSGAAPVSCASSALAATLFCRLISVNTDTVLQEEQTSC